MSDDAKSVEVAHVGDPRDPVEVLASPPTMLPKFSDRLALHLANVKSADVAHRLVRNEADQKIDALVRMLAEQDARLAALENPLTETSEAPSDPECPA